MMSVDAPEEGTTRRVVPAGGFGLMFSSYSVVPKYLPYLLQGALVTLELCVCSMALAIVIGIVCAIATVTGGRFAAGWSAPMSVYAAAYRSS